MRRSWKILDPGDAEWPRELEGLPSNRPVRRLRILGDLGAGPRVAVVGTRKADWLGLETGRRIARSACEAGWSVVSGGALGVDTAAHVATLEHGGHTVVVMATAPGEVYPARNEALFSRVVEAGGALVTEVEPGRPVTRRGFLERNRIVAALSKLVVVVQAGVRSGALSTAAWGRRLGVRTLAVPAHPLSHLSAGTNRLIEQGRAEMILALDDVFEDRRRESRQRRRPTGSEARRIAGILGEMPLDVDRIVGETGKSPALVTAILVELELTGVAAKVPGEGWIRMP